jgi:hypothetical protein
MKQFKMVMLSCLLLILLLCIPVTAMGLYTPEVSDRHGVVTIRDVFTQGWIVGGEFGLTDDLAIFADLRDKNYNRAGIKYLLNPEFAALLGTLNSKIFLGCDYAENFTDNIVGIGELDIYKVKEQFATDVEVGIKFNLTPNLDIRTGLIGTITETKTSNSFQLGLGYRF